MLVKPDQSALLELEEERKNISRSKLLGYVFFAVGILMAAMVLFLVSSPVAGMICAALTIILGSIHLYKIGNKEAEYVYTFKQKIIRALLVQIDPNLSIDPEGGLSIAEFVHCGLFSQKPDRMSSEDQIIGRAGATRFHFSEVHAEYKTTVRTKNGTSEQWHDIFKGIIFVADFNKDFDGVTVVRAKDTGAAISAWVAKHLPVFSSSTHQLVQLENPEFSNEFVTYSSDQVEARYILTPSLMERLCELNSRCEYTISVSYINSCMFIAFPLRQNYFEPPIFKTLLNPDLLSNDIDVIKFMYGIVEDLNLNTRIWGK